MHKIRIGFIVILIPILVIEPAISAAVLYILPLIILLSMNAAITRDRIQMLNMAILISLLYLIGVSAESYIIRLIAIIFILFTMRIITYQNGG
ncbi:hypothetical protein [Jeotgalibacillus haloalkalitolerans]|uniref:Uncharacterized protein n=1 Tax=Jeotgalibacillus haloalkalitolerans TaxID=3104292 RepID=A0ABU5KPB5_9BACL|nr:hypothetical protein [Jeotgalibacillus sp. HH7-29]MDZ5713106.1 hypothetical protein [Jeotgalibacillus sp. HH7-29]